LLLVYFLSIFNLHCYLAMYYYRLKNAYTKKFLFSLLGKFPPETVQKP